MSWHETHGGRPITIRMLADLLEPVSCAERSALAHRFIELVSLPALAWYGRRVPLVVRVSTLLRGRPTAAALQASDVWFDLIDRRESQYRSHILGILDLLWERPLLRRTTEGGYIRSTVADLLVAAKATPKPVRTHSIERVIQLCYGLAARRIDPAWPALPSPEDIAVIQDMLNERAA